MAKTNKFPSETEIVQAAAGQGGGPSYRTWALPASSACLWHTPWT